MRIGITFSAFDLLHAGHILLLQDCRRQCDHLIVGLHVDPSIERPQKNTPVQSLFERYLQLRACRYVDSIIPYETESDLLTILASQKVDVRFLGSDYEDKPFTGERFCEESGIDITYHSRLHHYSTTELRERIIERTE